MRRFLALCCLVLPACWQDAPTPPSSACPRACARLEALGCPVAKSPTQEGAKCEEWLCSKSQPGDRVPIRESRLECIARVASCDDEPRCR